jgi:1,4-alpha-glucan branching enzyme
MIFLPSEEPASPTNGRNFFRPFVAYGPYFTDKYKTPWGNAVNFDNAGSDGVRHYFIENALMWLRTSI